MKTALLIYWSKTGNTEKVAYAIKQGLEEASIQVTMKKAEEAAKKAEAAAAKAEAAAERAENAAKKCEKSFELQQKK